MQTSVIPLGVCDLIKDSIHNFLWSSFFNLCKFHLVAREDIYSPKNHRELHIRSLKRMNEAFFFPSFCEDGFRAYN